MHHVQLLVLFFVAVSGTVSLIDDTCLAGSERQQQNATRPWAVLLWVTCVAHQAGASYKAAAGALVRNCAGVLTKDNWIVTAADCVSCPEQVSVTADVGALTNDIWRDQLAGNKVQRLSIDKVVFHPNYTPGGARGNVALLHLSVRIEAGKFVLRLANCSNDASFSQLAARSSEWASAALPSDGADRLVLRDSSVSLWPKDACSRALGPYYPELLCSQPAGVEPHLPLSVNATGLINYSLSVEQCYRRKGSPLVVLGKPGTVPRSSDATTTIGGCDWQLLGILSLGGAECNATGPSLFVNLCSYEAWLENTIRIENARFEIFSACPSPPQAPVNGYLCSSSDPISGITFCCNDGFRLVGSAMSAVCNLASKRWEPPTPLCEPVLCLSLPRPEHGSTLPQSCSNNTYLSSCLFTCDEGYSLVGNSLLTCERNGIWSSPPPRCNVINCGPPQQAASLKVQYSTTEFGAYALYQCGECFRSVDGGSLTTMKHCDASGMWRGTSPICEAVQCVPIVAPLNGGISQTSSLCGSLVRFYCNEGYLLVGIKETMCLISGQWSNPVPVCMSVSCAAPIVEGSNFNFSNHRYLYGRTVQVECDHCRRMEGGDGWLTCDSPGYWNRPLPRCNWIACPPPPFVPNLLMDPPGSLYFCDTFVKFSCSYGYQIEGAVSSTCQGNGTWSNAFPTCKAITCPPLSLSNGVIHTDPGPLKISRFACDPCFKLNGPQVIQCTSSGTWNDTIPRCDLILCSPLKPFVYGYATPGIAENRCLTSVTFECYPGYILNGPTSIRCASNGIWDQAQPTCQAVSCPPIPSPKSNSFICTATPTATPTVPQFGAVIKYCCADGYQVVGGGSEYVACTEDGVWSDPAPACQATTCLTPPTPSNGAITVNNFGGGVVSVAGSTNYSYHGYRSRVNFRCNAGYVLIGESVLTCGPGGSWDNLPPACRMSQCDYRCPPPPIPANGRLANIYPLSSNSSTFVLGTVAVFVCDTGFYLAGSASRTCRENGVWSDQVTRCYPFDQPRSKLLYKIADMAWQSNEQAYMSATDRIVLACQTQLKETGVVQSLSKLSGPALDQNVRVVQSGSPDSSLQLSLQPLTASSGLSVAGVYKCQVRSTTSSVVLVELLKIKVYSVLCPIPMSPANGSLLTMGTPPGSCSLYTCNEGYSLVGMETSVCYENGTWSNKQPVCVPTTDALCDPPVLTASVYVSPPSTVGGRYRVGDTVVYRCNPPTYRMVGASGAMCQRRSIWSAAPPICIAV